MSSSSSQRTNIPKQAPLAMFQPHKAQTYIFKVILAVSQQPYNFPSFQLPPGATIRAFPYGNAINTSFVYISDIYENAAQPNGFAAGTIVLTPGADVQVELAVDNLNELFASSFHAGDGVTLVVTVPALS